MNRHKRETRWYVVLIEPSGGSYNVEGLVPYAGYNCSCSEKALTSIVNFWKEALRCTT